MRKHLMWRGLVALACLALTFTGCSPGFPVLGPSVPSSRILFVGNSFTYINGGVDQEVKGLAPTIEAKSIAVGGYTLQDHWNDGEALKSIREQKWNSVVLQDQSQTPVIAQAQFVEYARKFNAEIRLAGGNTILFMTWERPDSVAYGVTTQNLANAYYKAGNELNARVAPVGIAFSRALDERPGLALYAQDGHPTAQGTYLAACVLYATIFSKSPAGNSYSAAGVSKEERDFLQRVAADVTGY